MLKQLLNLSLLVLLSIFVFQCTPSTVQKKSISRKDVKAAEHLIGIEFTNNEIDTLLNYLSRNRRGYDSLRQFTIENNTTPALYFDPRPIDFRNSAPQLPIDWPGLDSVFLPTNKNDLAFYSISELAFLLKSEQISSLELTRFFIDRIKQYDPILKATITLTEELAIQEAKRADKEIKAGIYRGPLHGIPYGVKDLLAVPGYKTTWGAMPYKDQILEDTATVYEKLSERGAVLIAKLSSGALARGDVWFGGKTINPWDTLQGASGSSAGSASATAAGLVPFSIGTETLGSITSPSTRCGVTGLRPTFGRVSRHGVMSLSWSMDKVGPICRDALDCAIVFDAIRGEDNNDKTVHNGAFNFNPKIAVDQLKVGVLSDLIDEDTTAIGDNCRKALEVFEEMGIETASVKLPNDFPFEVFDVILRAEAGAFFDELVRKNGDDVMVQQGQRSRANSLRQSRFIPAVEYLQANRHRQRLIEEMNSLMRQFDVILTPTFGGRQLLITNLSGHPVISIPTGFDEENHPTSISLLGNLYDEATILALAYQFQQQTEYDDQNPAGFE